MTVGAPAEEHQERAAQLERLAGLIAGSPHNLVARSQRPSLRAVHLAEAEELAPYLQARPGQRWLDLGTGGGLPGLVLAIHLPEVQFTLVDSITKKIREVHRFVDALGLANVEAQVGRAEELAHAPAHRAAYDGVISRAVARLSVVLELSRGFVAAGGRVLAVKGSAWEDELIEARGALAPLQLAHEDVVDVTSAPRPTYLVRMRAIGSPPAGIPRPPGVPQRYPLPHPA